MQNTWVQETPPISALLVREAEAWRALLNLHGSVVHLAGQMQIGVSDDLSFAFDEAQEASDQREAAYLGTLTQLCAACDSIVTEAIKIRGLRKAKRALEASELRDVLRTHADEALGVGASIGRTSAMTFASLASELRKDSQSLRGQMQQARALVQAAADCKGFSKLDSASAAIVMGYTDADGEFKCVRTVEKLLEQVAQRGGLTPENLQAALWEGDVVTEAAPPPHARTFFRRVGDRALQLQQANNCCQ